MTLLDRFNKQPAEIKKYQIDYSEWLPTSINIVTVTTVVTLKNPAAGDVGEPTLTVGATAVIGGTMYEYYLSSGTDKKNYKITFQANTNDAQKIESEIEFKVNDI